MLRTTARMAAFAAACALLLCGCTTLDDTPAPLGDVRSAPIPVTSASSAPSTPTPSLGAEPTAASTSSPSAPARAAQSPTAASVPAPHSPAVGIPDLWRSTVTARPTGSGVVPYDDLEAGSSVAGTLAGADRRQVSFGAGTIRFRNFQNSGDTTYNGIPVPADVAGLRGAGVGRTIFEMVPHTSTRKGTIPSTFPDTNQLSLMRVVSDRAVLSGFTLQATSEGHLYNGLRVQGVDDARISDIRVAGIAGDDSAPPGETFGINDYRTDGSIYSRVEIDGSGVGASAFGANDSTNITLRDCYFHDDPFSMGATFWKTSDITIVDSIAARNGYAGFNFERVSGTVRLVRPVMVDNRRADIRIASDTTSAHVTIVDPVFSGPKLRVLVPTTYLGHPERQNRSTIRLIVHGVDRTSTLLQFVTH